MSPPSQPAHSNSSARLTRGQKLGPALMFLGLWFVAAFYYWGDLGKWTDDWSFHLADPATGTFEWSRVLSVNSWRVGFWRPFHMRIASGLQTVLWQHDWAIHLIVASLHALNCYLLWRVMLRMCASRLAPAAVALGFLVCPVGHEAIYWVSTLGTGAGLTFFLLCTLGVQKFAVGRIGWGRLAWYSPLLLTLAWWYEQPAAAGPALGFAFLACAPTDQAFRRRFTRAAIIVLVTIASAIVYGVLFLGTARTTQRGNAGSFVTSDQVLQHARLIFAQTWEYLTLFSFGPGAITTGWQAFWSKPVQAWAVIGLMVVAVALFASWWMRGRANTDGAAEVTDHPLGITERSAEQRFWVVLYGLGISAASLMPALIVSNQWMCSRMMYIPVLGLLVAAGAALDLLASRSWARARHWRGRVTRASLLAILLPALGCGAIALVGVQSLWHTRRHRDDQLIRQFRQLVPDPPPHTVFIPVGVREMLVRTGSNRFDAGHLGPFEASWSARNFIRVIYGRHDVHGYAFNRWRDPAHGIDGLVGATRDGLVFGHNWLINSPYPQDDQGRVLVPWDKVVAYRIERGGRVRLVNRIRVEASANPAEDREVALNLQHARPRRLGAPGIIAALPDRVRPITQLDWTLTTGGQRVESRPSGEAPVWSAGRLRTAMSLHPLIPSLTMPCVASAELPASDSTRVLAWRASMMDYLWRVPKPLTDGVGISIWLDGQDAPLLRRVITPETLKEASNWISMTAEIPRLDRPTRIRLQLDAGPATDLSCDWCLITPPVLTIPEGSQTAGEDADAPG